MLSVIIPAHNEADYIGPVLEALIVQTGPNISDIEIVVAANACTDTTVKVAQSYNAQITARGWRLTVLDITEGGKPNALNQGDAAASGDMRLYLDADVICEPELLSQIVDALDRPNPAYASGKFLITPPTSWVTKHYARLWTRLPFMTTGVPGGGCYAVNVLGRARWGQYPPITADDSFVRLQFTPAERHSVRASYVTPLAEGLNALVRVRRRWDAGSREIAEKYPELIANEGKPPMRPIDHLRLFLGTPISYLVYALVILVVRFGHPGKQTGWSRGR